MTRVAALGSAYRMRSAPPQRERQESRVVASREIHPQDLENSARPCDSTSLITSIWTAPGHQERPGDTPTLLRRGRTGLRESVQEGKLSKQGARKLCL